MHIKFVSKDERTNVSIEILELPSYLLTMLHSQLYKSRQESSISFPEAAKYCLNSLGVLILSKEEDWGRVKPPASLFS